MKKRYIVAGILILLSLFSALLNHSYIGVIFQIILYGWFLYIIASVEKKGKDGPLVGSQKAQVIITEILGSFVAALFYHYCWKDRFPIKDKQSSKYFWIIFIVEILIVALIILIVAISPYVIPANKSLNQTQQKQTQQTTQNP